MSAMKRAKGSSGAARRAGLAAALLAGCGDFSVEELADLAFTEGMPGEGEVDVETPGDGAVAEGLAADGYGQRGDGLRVCRSDAAGELLCNGHRLARKLNGGARSVLRVLAAARGQAPSARGEGRREWGPFRGPGGEARWRLAVERGEGGFDWTLSARPDGEEGYVDIAAGWYAPGGERGEIAWRGRAARLKLRDSAALEVDELALRYELGGGGRRIEADVLLAPAEEDAARAPESGDVDALPARWHRGQGLDSSASQGLDSSASLRFEHERLPGGGGSWGYTLSQDVNEDGVLDEVEVRARWGAEREGRSDARVTLGGARIPTSFGVHECWDERLARTYFDSDVRAICRRAGGCPKGEAERCTFEPLLPPLF